MLVNKWLKNLNKVLKKLNLGLPYDKGMLLINIFHKETKSVYPRDIYAPMSIQNDREMAKKCNQPTINQ